MNRMNLLVSTLGLFGLFGVLGCTETECATPDYTRAECRVLAENELARLLGSSGLEVRFHAYDETDEGESWTADGLVTERGELLMARVAHMGPFALSLRDTSGTDQTRELELVNLHPLAVIDPDPNIVELSRSGTKRRVQVSVPSNGTTWIRASLESACTPSVRLAVVSDVQTNPSQFVRILDRLQLEQADAAEAGELLLGVVFAGDLTESSRKDEFDAFADMLEAASVPFALTPGNHDVYTAHQPVFNQTFGPGNHAFGVCGVHVAILDTGSGSIADSIVGRLPELLDAQGAEHSLMAMHHPPYAALTGFGWSREDLAGITLGEFAQQDGDLVIAGHGHLLQAFQHIFVGKGELDEIIAGTGGATQGAGQPLYGYVRLRFVNRDIQRCFVEVPPPGASPRTDTGTVIPMCDGP